VTLTLPIREVVHATPRARIVRIDLGTERFPYLAGQAVLVASHGRGRRRPYSIAAPPEDALRERCLELLVGVDAAGSPGAHLTLEAHALVDVEGPLGRFTLPEHPAEQRFLFLAGGTGIAPLRAMLRHTLHEPHRQIGLFYSVRTAGEFAYEDEFRTLAREGRIELRQTVTRETGFDGWEGPRGRIGSADLEPLVHGSATLCFVCGPPAFVADMLKLLDGLGVPRPRIRVEEF
jgi:ferredoxin-NADP reductase